MRFQKELINIYEKKITKRRLSCAERALKKQRDKIPLFASQLVQPTALQRIQNFDADLMKQIVVYRHNAAKGWVEFRQKIKELAPGSKIKFLEYWNNSSCPGSSVYALTILRKFQ